MSDHATRCTPTTSSVGLDQHVQSREHPEPRRVQPGRGRAARAVTVSLARRGSLAYPHAIARREAAPRRAPISAAASSSRCSRRAYTAAWRAPSTRRHRRAR